MLIPASSLLYCQDSTDRKEATRLWTEDIRQLESIICKKHIDPFTIVTREEFKGKVDKLIKRAGNLNDDKMKVEIATLAASIGDSHTGIRIQADALFPYSFSWFDDGLFVIATGPDNKHCLGSKLEAINSIPVDSLILRISAIIPHENESQIKAQLPTLLVQANVLYGLGITDNKENAIYSFKNAEDEIFDINSEAVGRENLSAFGRSMVSVTTENIPFSRQNQKAFYWFRIIENNRAIYMQFNSCTNDPEYPFDDFTNDMFHIIDSLDIQKLIIDFRFNGGGNSGVFSPMLKAIIARPEINQKERLVVLTGRRTFSSAILNILELRSLTRAIFIGEPTGGKPNHFGEVKKDNLRNSGLAVSWSTRYFRNDDKDEASFYPDILVPYNYEDFRLGIDPVFEAALSRK